MYDRQTESLWPQLTGQASVGVLTGIQLQAIPMGIVGWERFRETHHPGQASALDADRIPEGEEVGSVGVFHPVLDGRRLTFAVRDGRVVDEQTGSTWNVLGRATAGKFKGSSLRAVVHLDTLWFAWVGFHPGSRLLE